MKKRNFLTLFFLHIFEIGWNVVQWIGCPISCDARKSVSSSLLASLARSLFGWVVLVKIMISFIFLAIFSALFGALFRRLFKIKDNNNIHTTLINVFALLCLSYRIIWEAVTGHRVRFFIFRWVKTFSGSSFTFLHENRACSMSSVICTVLPGVSISQEWH